MGVFLILEASQPSGRSYRLGLGWHRASQSGLDGSGTDAAVLNDGKGAFNGAPFSRQANIRFRAAADRNYSLAQCSEFFGGPAPRLRRLILTPKL
jgi:hypothetical protein